MVIPFILAGLAASPTRATAAPDSDGRYLRAARAFEHRFRHGKQRVAIAAGNRLGLRVILR